MKTSLTALAAMLLAVGAARAQESAKPDEAATKLLIANERALLNDVEPSQRQRVVATEHTQ